MSPDTIFKILWICGLCVLSGWIVGRRRGGKRVELHHIFFGLSVVSGVCAYGFFMAMNVPASAKVLVSMGAGALLILLSRSLSGRG